MTLPTSRSGLAVVKSVDDWESPPPFTAEQGSAFGFNDRMFYGFEKDKVVYDTEDWRARDMIEMFPRDYKAKQVESVLALPIMSATHRNIGIKGDKGENDWLSEFWDADYLDGGCKTDLDTVIAGMTTAITFKKAFFELVFRPDALNGKIGYEKVAFRPQTTCRTLRDPKNGELIGFEQEAFALTKRISADIYPIKIPRKRSFIYLHGSRLDAINGTSDLEVAYWCYKTKQKILFLWMQYLESVALPRTVVKSADTEVARQIAAQIARMRGSSVIPIGTSGNANSVSVDTLDSSGKGGEQFKEAIAWLDVAATQSVLAGFLDLTGMAAARGVGSMALSKDASDYFLQFEEAKTREFQKAIRRDLYAPLIRYNFGRKGKVPKLEFEPLNDEDKSAQVAMLNTLMQAKGPTAVPDEFVATLAQQVGVYFGMDGDKLHDAFLAAGKAAAAQAAAQSPAGASPLGQQAASMAGATNAAANMLNPARSNAAGKLALPPELAHLDFQSLGSMAA